MKGLELSRLFYEEHGYPMLLKDFPDVIDFIAVGLAGSGSECYGYDDSLSTDHDFEPGFCIFIPDGVLDPKTEFRLSRAYSALPKSFMGYKRSLVNPVGGSRHGVISIGDFFESKTGSRDGSLSLSQWFSLPEYALFEAVNGEIFCDNYGQFTEIRKKLSYFPEDVRLKKLAGHLLLMGQSGQYNYQRCISRNDTGAAQLALFEFTKSCINAAFLINRVYMPYYKWCFRALNELTYLSSLSSPLEALISEGNTGDSPSKKAAIIEAVCSDMGDALKELGLSDSAFSEMELQAYTVNESVNDNNIRNANILYGV